MGTREPERRDGSALPGGEHRGDAPEPPVTPQPLPTGQPPQLPDVTRRDTFDPLPGEERRGS